MSVILRKRKNANGTTTLMLDIYHNGKRSYERLSHLQLAKPSNLKNRGNNKELLQQAEAIRLARLVDLERKNYNMENEAAKKTIVTVWMQSYVDSYTKKDKRNMQGVLNRFIDFLKMEKKSGLTFGNLNPLLIEDFIDYLQERSTGEGAKSYYSRFKKMLKNAFRKRFMEKNIIELVEKTAKGKAAKKDTLTLDELKTLAATPSVSKEVKRAALFSCVTGLAWVDIKALTWDKIKLDSCKMEIVRAKQEVNNVTVSIPLNNTAITLLGEAGKPKHKVFDLPTANGANKTLKAWVKRAGIDKKMTWHNLRHSYGTNLILNDVDVVTASKLLGHQSLAQTNRYVDSAAELKQKATDKINIELPKIATDIQSKSKSVIGKKTKSKTNSKSSSST
ncbi:MAG: site-specific integrase [Bacteroidota bacterium]